MRYSCARVQLHSILTIKFGMMERDTENVCTGVVAVDGDSTSALMDDDIKRMRVAELRVELSQRGLDAKC